MNGVHPSVLLDKVKFIALALALNIERTDFVLTLTENRRAVDDKNQLHHVVCAELLVVTVPSPRRGAGIAVVGLPGSAHIHNLL
jgi:hypothetical protein